MDEVVSWCNISGHLDKDGVKIKYEELRLNQIGANECFGILDLAYQAGRFGMRNNIIHIKSIIVDKEVRGQGLGSKALRSMVDKYPNHLIYLVAGDIENEGNNLSNTLKLLYKFYTKNGFQNVNDKIGLYEYRESYLALNEAGRELIGKLY